MNILSVVDDKMFRVRTVMAVVDKENIEKQTMALTGAQQQRYKQRKEAMN